MSINRLETSPATGRTSRLSARAANPNVRFRPYIKVRFALYPVVQLRFQEGISKPAGLCRIAIHLHCLGTFRLDCAKNLAI